jgi:hypothetical protein
MYELIVGIPPYYNTKKEVLFDNIKRYIPIHTAGHSNCPKLSPLMERTSSNGFYVETLRKDWELLGIRSR